MHEQDFKQALRDSMAVVTVPPPMNETEVLDAAKRVVRRRRAMWASGASVVGVVALAAGVAFASPGTDRSGPQIGAVTSTNPSPSSPEPDWPDGQTDFVPTSGPRYEQSVTLLNELLGIVPAGFESPADLTGMAGAPYAGQPLRSHTTVWQGDETWMYEATIPVATAGKVGMLDSEVWTSDSTTSDPDNSPCERTGLYMPWGSCQEVTVAGVQIGVVSEPGRMGATHRYADGTVVFVAQSVEFQRYGYPALSELPYSSQQLAELVTDPRFHLD